MKKKIDRVLDIFKEINSIPRKSKNETRISNWLVSWAEDNGFEVERDDFLDVLIRVPGTKGFENSEPVVFQGHMDMVCEKSKESNHDFANDPISMYIEDGWLKARETSLGADNGIALAIAMALATDPDVEHPPLELLFTVDEETGLTGAVNLRANWLKGKILINIDSEDEGVFTIGCAGGRDAKIDLEAKEITDFPGDSAIEIKVSGLKGGHSGVDIHLERGNANIILTRIIKRIEREGIEVGISDITGGTAHNAIPRDSSAVIALKSSDISRTEQIISESILLIKNEYKKVESGLAIEISRGEKSKKVYDTRIIDLILSLPNGVMYNSQEMKGIVETSSNVAVISMDGSSFKILMSQRSSVMSRLDEICNKIDSLVKLSGAKVEFGGGYPAWQPDFDSEILKVFKKHYKRIFKKEAVIEVIHAGLECGVIGSKYPEMEMISIGPTIKNAHSPDEMMLVDTVYDIWVLLVEVLKGL